MSEPQEPASQNDGAAARPRARRIFVSRSSQDKDFVLPVVEALQRFGYDTRVQDHDILIGDSFVTFMDKSLRECAATVALLSPSYLNSEWCRDEALSAYRQSQSKTHRLVPLVIRENCEPDGLIACFVYLDITAIAEEPNRVAAIVHEVLVNGKPLEEIAAAKPLLRRKFVSNLGMEDALLVGREDDEKLLDQLLEGHGSVAVAAVAGMAGVGKSWLARVYGAHRKDRYRGVWMIRSENTGEMLKDIAALGMVLDRGLIDVKDHRQAAVATLNLIAEAAGPPFLLIYDNVEHPISIRDYLPRSGAHVIVTTRWNAWSGTGIEKLTIETLTLEASADLLCNLAPDIARLDALRIAAALGRLPLALAQAGGPLRIGRLNADEYLADLDKRLAVMPESQRDFPNPVRAALESNLAQMAKVNPWAAALLEIAAVCAPEDIPFDLLETASARKVLPAQLHSRGLLKEAVGTLEAFSLARLNTTTSPVREGGLGWTLSLHRLVQLIVRTRLAENGRLEPCHAAVEGLNELYPYASVRNWPVCTRLQLHAETALAHVGADYKTEGAARLLDQAGFYQLERGETQIAEQMMRRGLSVSEAVDKDRMRMVDKLNNLAFLLTETQRPQEADAYFNTARAILEESGAESRPDLLSRTLNNSVRCLLALGRLSEAEARCRQAIALDQQFRPYNTNISARNCQTLGVVLRMANRPQESEDALREAIRLGEVASGETTNQARSLQDLALVLHDAGRAAEACELMARALLIFETQYGLRHEQTIYARQLRDRFFMPPR